MTGHVPLRFRITGVCPLLLHNGRLADPLDEHAKAMAQVSAKRKKTEADHRRLSELEWMGSLYLDGGRPCIPGEMLEAALVKAASLQRRGLKAKAGIVVRDNPTIDYDGPGDLDSLWRDGRFILRCGARVGTSRIMRTRPMFKECQAEAVVEFLSHLLNAQDVVGYMNTAGEQIGVGDWRPRFGRFTAELAPEQVAVR